MSDIDKYTNYCEHGIMKAYCPKCEPEPMTTESKDPMTHPMGDTSRTPYGGSGLKTPKAMTTENTVDRIELAAKALWDRGSHKLLEKAGHPTDWESQPNSIKISMRNDVKASNMSRISGIT